MPDGADALFRLGASYADAGDLPGALDAFERCVAAAPGSAEAAAGLAAVLERMGDIDRAMATLEPVVAAGARSPNVALVFGRICLTAGAVAEGITVVRDALAQPIRTPAQRGSLHVQLAALLDRARPADADEAFDHLVEGNRLLDPGWDSDAHARAVDAIISAFPRRRVAISPRAPEGTTVVLVVGMPRSGTTVVHEMLARHPAVRVVGESDALPNAVGQLFERLGVDSGDFVSLADRLRPADAEWLADAYLDAVGGAGREVLVDKMPQNFLLLGVASLALPGLRIVHCTRDAVDTALSCFFQPFSAGHGYSYRLDALGRYYADYRRVMAHWRATLAVPMIDVCYERTVLDVEGTARALSAFVGVPFDERSVAFHAAGTPVHTASYAQVRAPVYSTSVGRSARYRHRLGALLAAMG